MVNLEDTFSLLTDAVPVDGSTALIKKCKELDMLQIAYVDSGFDSNIPEFDKGYNFVYKTNDSVEAKLEILEKDLIIMQAGIQIIYPPSLLFSKAKNHFNILKRLSDDYYDESLPMNISGAEILNYGNPSSVCYLNRIKALGRNTINFRVGNKTFW